MKYINLEKKIDIKFTNKDLLRQSLTHKSFDTKNNYEKLEFLGDRVLGLVISKRLLEIYPDEKEGILDKKLASLVNKKICLEIGKNLELEKFIITNTSSINKTKKTISIENKIISDCCEALIGAIFLDKGLNIIEKFILKTWKHQINASKITFVDSKTKLQEYSLKKFKSLPIYKLLENSGPRHKPTFKIGVRLIDTKFFYAQGNSKKDAEQNAATLFMENIGKK